MDPFEALNVSRDASISTIKSQYRTLLRRYHPNCRQGHDDNKDALIERFIAIQQAWKLLNHPESRRRWLELLRLLDEQESLLDGVAALIEEVEHKTMLGSPTRTELHDGNVSSDADEGDDVLPSIGLYRRKTVLEKMGHSHPHHDHTDASDARVGTLHRRLNAHDSALHLSRMSSRQPYHVQEEDYFVKRRRKLAKLRRKESEAFFRHKEAMIQKFEAELEAERTRDAYEAAKWNRDYFEKAPREIAERMRSFQQVIGAVRAFGPSPDKRPHRPTLSTAQQILSTDDTFDADSFLTVGNHHLGRRSLHQRGYSSDVSGDQTSSEDDTGDDRMLKGSRAYIWRPQSKRLLSLNHALGDASVFAQRQDHKGTEQQSALHSNHEPFRMLVKRPTGFAEDIGRRESSAESPASSWSASPAITPLPSPSLHQFTLAQPTLLARFVGTSRDMESVDSISQSRNGTLSHMYGRFRNVNASHEVCDFRIKPIGKPRFNFISEANVHTLDTAEKAHMLGTPVDPELSPHDLMNRLALLDRNIATKLIVKPDIKEVFNFRLIRTQDCSSPSPQDSFIALSYRRRLHVKHEVGRYSLPLEPQLFQAMLEERVSEDEGVWIDQICIDQESERECTISMSAMDMVYRSARLAVVILDDLEFDAREAMILSQHMEEHARMSHVNPNKRFRHKQPPYLSTHDELCNIVQKLLQSSWFRRAWCRHEMRLAREHVFLLPYSHESNSERSAIIRFTGRCLTHLLALATEVPLVSTVEMVKPALHAFFRDRYSHGDKAHGYIQHGNFTTVIAEVFAMEAGGDPRISAWQRAADALKDKSSIVLNTMECGLALAMNVRAKDVHISKSECQYMLLTLALAARDPAALCSVGPPMQFSLPDALSPTASSTWLFEPTNVDSGLNNYRTLSRIAPDAKVTTHVIAGEHFVSLDLQMLNSAKRWNASDDNGMLSLARRIVTEIEKRRCGRNRNRYLVSDVSANRHFGSMIDIYTETLACVLECGPDWVDQVCHRYRMSRRKQDLQGAYELLIALKNTDANWPEHAWTDHALGFLMDFVNFILIRALPQRQIMQHEPWRPIWVQTDNGGKVVTFISPGTPHTAVPTVLLDPDYIHLARLWVLTLRSIPPQNASRNGAGIEWTLLGKSVLFSDDLAAQHLQSTAGIHAKQQKVFGREDPQLLRILRERSFPI